MPMIGRYARYVPELIRTYFPLWRAQKEHALEIEPYIQGVNPMPIVSNAQSKQEQEALKAIASTPYGMLIINSCVQSMKVVGIRSAEDDGLPDIWRNLWVKNQMKARQTGIVQAAVGYGIAYSSLLPGQVGFEGQRNTTLRGLPTGVSGQYSAKERADLAEMTASSSVVWKIYSPMTMTAFFAEPHDHFPTVALNGIEQLDADGKYLLFEVFDDEAVHWAVVREYDTMSTERMKVAYIESRPHDIGVCPIIAHTPRMTGNGSYRGELIPFLPIIHRIDQTTYDRLLVQRQAAWSTRWATGLDKPTNSQEMTLLKAGDLMVSPRPETKFGALPPSPMGDHIDARKEDIQDLAATSQTPPYMMQGLASSMQPESLAAITSGYYAKMEDYQDSLGESYEQAFRLAAEIEPSLGDLSDFAEVRWKGFRPYSLTQVADALGKLAQQLHVPVEMLFEQVPFFTDEDVKRAAEGAEKERQRQLEEQMALKPPAAPGGGGSYSGGDKAAGRSANNNPR